MKNLQRALAMASFLFCGAASAQSLEVINIGSGDIDGGYYHTAKTICGLINRQRERKLHCSPDPTVGSIYNLQLLEDGELDFALVQSDWHQAAYHGSGRFNGKAFSDLRSVMSIYPEVITILVGRDSEIYAVKDIVGKRIDIGPPSSGRHGTASLVFENLGMDLTSALEVLELRTDNSITALCDGSIDASVFVVGHPSNLIATALSECGARILRLSGPKLAKVFAETSEISSAAISANHYPELQADVESYAVFATLVTRADVSENLVKSIVDSTAQNLKTLAIRVPQMSGSTLKSLQTQGLTAPLHPAAARAFLELYGEQTD